MDGIHLRNTKRKDNLVARMQKKSPEKTSRITRTFKSGTTSKKQEDEDLPSSDRIERPKKYFPPSRNTYKRAKRLEFSAKRTPNLNLSSGRYGHQMSGIKRGGGDGLKRYPLLSGTATLGREMDSDIRVLSPDVADHHATLTVNKGQMSGIKRGGGDGLKRYPLLSGTATLGREMDSDIRVLSPDVADHHATLTVNKGQMSGIKRGGGDGLKRYPLLSGTATLGREMNSDIRVLSPDVADHHATLTVNKGQMSGIKRGGEDGLKRYPLLSGTATLGREMDSDIRVLSPDVADLHATLTVNKGQMSGIKRGGGDGLKRYPLLSGTATLGREMDSDIRVLSPDVADHHATLTVNKGQMSGIKRGGGDGLKRYPLLSGTATLGREMDSDIRVLSPDVADHHATLTVNKGQMSGIKRGGEDGLKRYPLLSGTATLGREMDSDIRVLSPDVADLHATLTVNKGQMSGIKRGGGDGLKRYPLLSGTATLGREMDSDIRVLSPDVADHHATLTVNKGQECVDTSEGVNALNWNPKQLITHLKSNGYILHQCTFCSFDCTHYNDFMTHCLTYHPNKKLQAQLCRVVADSADIMTEIMREDECQATENVLVPEKDVNDDFKTEPETKKEPEESDIIDLLSDEVFLEFSEIMREDECQATENVLVPEKDVNDEFKTEPETKKEPEESDIIDLLSDEVILEFSEIKREDECQATENVLVPEKDVNDEFKTEPETKKEPEESDIIDLLSDEVFLEFSEIMREDECQATENVLVPEKDLYACGRCKTSFINDRLLRTHLKKCLKPCKCAHCSFYFASASPLIKHMNDTHIQQNLYLCGSCGFVDSNPRKVIAHVTKSYRAVTVTITPDKESSTAQLLVSKVVGKDPKIYTSGKKFGPNDIETLPTKPIFDKTIYCSCCEFNSRARTNMIWHLQQHRNEAHEMHYLPTKSDGEQAQPGMALASVEPAKKKMKLSNTAVRKSTSKLPASGAK